MKNLLTAVLILGCFTAFSQKKIDGTWKGTRETANGSFEVTYTFKAEGKVLTGTWKTQFGEAPLQNGKIDGKSISYTVAINDRTIDYTGEIVSDDEIKIKNEMGEMKIARVQQYKYCSIQESVVYCLNTQQIMNPAVIYRIVTLSKY